uniref:Uncharacterized protein isoform X1 n=1 Tax=Pogona vitticeps TaxID=103695 RepID=A0ABM5FIJ7_9SAUR
MDLWNRTCEYQREDCWHWSITITKTYQCSRETDRESVCILVAMEKLWLSLMLAGSAAAFLLTAPKSSIAVPPGGTALLPASVNFSASVPEYFQVRWYFLTGPHIRLILIVKADNCQAQNGSQYWKDSCEISIWKTSGYEHRVELSSEDVSLVLWDTRAEDSGTYSVTFLALGVKSSANISLTVSNETSYNYDVTPDMQFLDDDKRKTLQTNNVTRIIVGEDAPMSLVKVANETDYGMSSIIRLTLGGLILCLLALILGEHISFTYCTAGKTASWGGRETTLNQATVEPTAPSRLDDTSVYVEMRDPDELYCTISG